MAVFKGSAVALITPFHEDGRVNFEVLDELIEFHITNGTDAIVTCGTTGEPSTMSDEEQLEVIEYTVKKVNKRIPVIGGAGSNDTRHGVKLCQSCEKAGVDALLIVTPYYNKTTQRGLIEHFTDCANAVSLPIILYNVPSRTNLNIEPETALELSKVKNIVAIKEASGNISHIAELASLCHGKLDIYSGNDDQIVPILSLGGLGVISVIANITPKDTHDLVMKYLDGDVKGAMEMQLNSIPLANALFTEVNPIPVKAATSLIGFDTYNYRKPLVKMSDYNFEYLKIQMINYGLIK